MSSKLRGVSVLRTGTGALPAGGLYPAAALPRPALPLESFLSRLSLPQGLSGQRKASLLPLIQFLMPQGPFLQKPAEEAHQLI